MRRRKKIITGDYIRVRIEQLTEERAKNDDPNSHLILDKSIYELSIVLDLITRDWPQDPAVRMCAVYGVDPAVWF